MFIEKAKAVFCLCDLQAAFVPALRNPGRITFTAKRMLDAADLLDIPCIVSEQYPASSHVHAYRVELGKTIVDTSRADLVAEKTCFSMLGCRTVSDYIQSRQLSDIVLFGIETQVCVQQTALDCTH